MNNDSDDDISIPVVRNSSVFDDITETNSNIKYNVRIINSNITFHEHITPLYSSQDNLEKIDNIQLWTQEIFRNQHNSFLKINNVYVYKNSRSNDDYIVEHNVKSIKIENLSTFIAKINECYNYKNNLYISEVYVKKPSITPIIYILTYPNIEYIKHIISNKIETLSKVKIIQIVNLKKFSINILFALVNYLKKIQLTFTTINEAMILSEIQSLSQQEKLLLIDYKTSSLPKEVKELIRSQ